MLQVSLEQKQWRNTRIEKASYVTWEMWHSVPVSQILIWQRKQIAENESGLWQCNKSFSKLYDIEILLGPHHLPRNYPAAFGSKLVTIFEEMITTKKGMPDLPTNLPSAEETFQSMEFTDVWQDAEVVSVCHWLRGGRDLRIPETFRPLLPNKLWSSSPGNLNPLCLLNT